MRGSLVTKKGSLGGVGRLATEIYFYPFLVTKMLIDGGETLRMGSKQIFTKVLFIWEGGHFGQKEVRVKSLFFVFLQLGIAPQPSSKWAQDGRGGAHWLTTCS